MTGNSTDRSRQLIRITVAVIAAGALTLLAGCASKGKRGDGDRERRTARAANVERFAGIEPMAEAEVRTVPVEEEDPGFAARRQYLLQALAGPWVQPFPNFSNAQMHYSATVLARMALADDPLSVPAVRDGDYTEARPPLFWGVLKYDGEDSADLIQVAEGEFVPARPRGAGPHATFSWQPNLFHFNFPGLAALMGRYPGLPVWNEPHHRDPSTTYREHYLRYVLNRRDNYNAFTGEGTENHINMSRPSAWVLASEAARLGYDFADAPYSARVRAAQMKDWVRAWSKRVYEVGIGEWDSGIYHGVSLQGWLIAYDYAGTEHGWDPEVRAAARAVIDYYAAVLALKHVNFHIGAASMRGVRDHSSLSSGTAYLAYLWFGKGDAPMPGNFNGSHAGEIVYAAISGYRPPLAAVELAQKDVGDPAVLAKRNDTYFGRKPNYLLQQPTQGVEVIHIGPNYMLGSANLAVGGFSSSTWQIVPWKLAVFAGEGESFPSIFTGNGGFYGLDRSHTRDPWMQLVQHGNVLIQMQRVPKDADQQLRTYSQLFEQWKHRWMADFRLRWETPNFGGFNGQTINGETSPLNSLVSMGDLDRARTSFINYPPDADVVEAGTIAFLRVRETYVAVRAIYGTHPIHDPAKRTLSDSAPPGQLGGLVIEVGSAPEYGSFVAFQQRLRARTRLDLSERDRALTVAYTNLFGDRVRATYETVGSWREPEYDWSFGVRSPGGVSLMHAAPWQQPDWPRGEGHGRQPSWAVNGSKVDPSIWPVIDGPKLKLDRSRLTFRRDGERIHVIER